MFWFNTKLGAAYYNVVTSELFVLEDTMDDAEHFDVVKALYRQCAPRHVVVNAGSSAAFLKVVKEIIIAEESKSFDSRTSGITSTLHITGKKEYSFERCSHRVRCLRVEFEPKNVSNVERLTFLNTILDFKCCTMMHALGALLLFIDKHWNNIALDPAGKPSFLALNYVSLKDLVMVDEDSYKALNIVQARDHPSLFKFGKTITRTRGVSLYSLFNRYCQSRPGMQFLWKTLHHPMRNLAVLQQRLKVLDFFLNLDNHSVVENLSAYLRHVCRLNNAIFACCSGPQAKVSNWIKLEKTISNLICIADICGDHAGEIELFKRIADTLTTEIQHIKYFIEYLVDFAESRKEGNLVVKENVDAQLDELNHVRRTLPDLLTRMGEKDMREYLPPLVTNCRMIYLPNIGYVLAINKWNVTPPEDATFPNLEFKFTISNVNYYKTPTTRELDETIGDIVLRIAVRRNQIMKKLVQYIKKHTGTISSMIQLCAELDTLLAFSKAARDYNYVKPRLTEAKIIDVVEGRHPLMECATTFVPNDIRSGNGKSLIKVLTGPNSSGKSVYLKQIGLTVFMAHIGSYIPAKSATIGMVSHILTQMSNTESIALNASSFLQNLRQINVILRASTPNSLLISDELDRGTSESSGVALVASVIDTFAERGDDCPHAFFATHAHEVIRVLPQTPLIEIQTFEYTISDDESMVFFYRLINGSSNHSFAHHVANMAGLDQDVIDRALQVYTSVRQQKLPPPVANRFDRVKLLLNELERDRQMDLKKLKMLVKQAVYPK
ncbi:mutS protein homolog 5-like [Ceratina calcarata]|uniref:MutS protein homolog 5-like n=1 Tax=Ceratina calcarata TaxID=156304 RepID=A0AAJ7RXN0_9HYME|nr:mutS protein homolog 5-like [Ceratina calcarata]